MDGSKTRSSENRKLLGYEMVDWHEIAEHGVAYTEFVFQLERDAWLSSAVCDPYRRSRLWSSSR